MSDAPDGPARPLPGVEGDADDVPAFDEPWQARAFGVAVALAAGSGVGGDGGPEGSCDWSAFQSRLIAAVGADGGGDPGDGGIDPAAVDGAYYRQWLTALERLLDERGLLDPEEVAERAAEFAAGDRDASEFVAGDR